MVTKMDKQLEFNFMHKPKILCVVGKSSAGKCVKKDTIINNHGCFMTFDELEKYAESDLQLLSDYGNLQKGYFFKEIADKTIRITSNTGVVIEGTPEHKIKVLDIYNGIVWKRLDELNNTDSLLITTNNQCFMNDNRLKINITKNKNDKCSIKYNIPKILETKLSYLFGVIIANASFNKGSINISSYNVKLLELLKDYIQTIFNYNTKYIYLDKKKVGLRISSIQILNFLKINGLDITTARFKTVPLCIRKSTKQNQIYFLKGLFDCDSSYSRGFEWSTASKELHDMVKSMLFNLGIFNQTSQKYLPEYNHIYYRLYMSNINFNKYLKMVNYNYKLNYLNINILNTNIGISTNGFKLFIHNMLDKYKFSKNGTIKFNGKTIRVPEKYSKLKSRLYGSRHYLRNLFLQDSLIPEIDDVCDYLYFNDVYLDNISHIEVINFNDFVYDFHIPFNHTFIANGLISHNTTAVEYIEHKYNIPMIQSYTDRLPRFEGENGHTFITTDEMKNIPLEKKLAYTTFGDYEYCCTTDDVKPKNTYVIDETGLEYLINNFNDDYDIYSIFINSNYNIRLNRAINQVGNIDLAKSRLDRDKDKYHLFDNQKFYYYDMIIQNNSDLPNLYAKLDYVVENMLGDKK